MYGRFRFLPLLFLLPGFAFILLMPIQATPAISQLTGTVINGDITTPTTWVLADSPYRVSGNVHVQAPLTIDPGVVVKMNPGSRLDVYGYQLTINGTVEQPVYITSIKDDTVAGDTNGDGNASSPAAGDWGGIILQTGSIASITHTNVQYATTAFRFGDTAALSISDSIIRQSEYAVYAQSSGQHAINITRSQFIEQTRGLSIHNATGGIYASALLTNIIGIEITNSIFEVKNSSFHNNTIPLSIAASGVQLDYENNAIGNNTINAIRLVGNVATDTVWINHDNLPYYLETLLTVNSGVTLTVGAGVVVKAREGGSGGWPNPIVALSRLQVDGYLVTQGTSTAPVIFTSLRDDANAAGDTNNDGNATEPGRDWSHTEWGGIHLAQGGEMLYTEVRYAGYTRGGAVEVAEGTTFSARNSTFFHNNNAITVLGSTLDLLTTIDLEECTISTNSGNGIHAGTFGQQQVTVRNSLITGHSSGTGIWVHNARGGVYGNVFQNNSTGLYTSGETLYVMKNNTFHQNNLPFAMAASGVQLDYQNNTIDNNTVNGVRLVGDVTEDTVWVNHDNVPYYLETLLTVRSGVTLTVGAGVIVKAREGGSGGWPNPIVALSRLQVDGYLVTQGTPTEPVIFTSLRDDENTAGDTNNDGNATEPGRDWGHVEWGGIHLAQGGKMVYTEVRYAGYTHGGAVEVAEGTTFSARNSTFYHNNNAIIVVGSEENLITTIDVTECTLRANSGNGIYAGTSGQQQVTIRNSLITDQSSGIGIWVHNARGGVYDSVFENNATGLYTSGETLYTVENNTFHNNNFPFSMAASGVQLTYENNAIGNNTINAIRLVGNVATDTVWINHDNLPYYLETLLTVNSGVTLTVGAGVVVKAREGGSGGWPNPIVALSRLQVDGYLVTQGTSTAPVVFTSLRDDTNAAGDTNNDGNSSEPGRDWGAAEWGGIHLAQGGEMLYTEVRYAGYTRSSAVEVVEGATFYARNSTFFHNNNAIALLSSYDGKGATLYLTRSILLQNSLSGIQARGPAEHELNIYRSHLLGNGEYGISLDFGKCDIYGSRISENGNIGLLINSTSACVLRNNDIFKNTNYGIAVGTLSPTAIQAAYNWWGSAFGPRILSDPFGAFGDSITLGVNFLPFNSLPIASEVEPVPLVPTDLTVDTPVTFRLDAFSYPKFRLNTQEGRTLRVSLRIAGNPTEAAQLWLWGKEGNWLTSDTPSYIGSYSQALQQTILNILETRATSYVFSVGAPFLDRFSQLDVTITAEYVDHFFLTAVAPSRIANKGNVTLGLRGAGFDQSTQVTLIGPNQERVTADSLYLSEIAFANASFRLENTTPGFYDVELRNIDGSAVSILSDAVEIVQGPIGILRLWLEGPAGVAAAQSNNTRYGKAYPYTLHYKNIGLADMPAPFLVAAIVNGQGVLVSGQYTSTERLAWFASGSGQNSSVLAPGEAGHINLQITAFDDINLALGTINEDGGQFNWEGIKETWVDGADLRFQPSAENWALAKHILGDTRAEVYRALRHQELFQGTAVPIEDVILRRVWLESYRIEISEEPDIGHCKEEDRKKDTDWCPNRIWIGEYSQQFADSDVKLFLADTDKILTPDTLPNLPQQLYDPRHPAILITHGWTDTAFDPKLVEIARMLANRYPTHNIIRVSWPRSAISPWECGPHNNFITRDNPITCPQLVSIRHPYVVNAILKKLKDIQYEKWDKTLYIGHSFGNAINARVSKETGRRGTALLLNPANNSGFALGLMPDYADSFQKSLVIYSVGLGDEGVEIKADVKLRYEDPICANGVEECRTSSPSDPFAFNNPFASKGLHASGKLLLLCLLTNEKFFSLPGEDKPYDCNLVGKSGDGHHAEILIEADFTTLGVEKGNLYSYWDDGTLKRQTLMGQIPICLTQDCFGSFAPAFRNETRITSEYSILSVTSIDPNDKQAPVGFGEQRIIPRDTEMTYVINFENMESATAPVQELRITDQLDPNLDWSTFRFTGLDYSGQFMPINHTAGTELVQTHIYPPTEVITGVLEGALRLEVQAIIEYQTGQVEWYLRVIDDATGDFPLDPLAGFLPPEDGTGRGQGYVTFSVKPKADIPIGTIITNTATIVFDYNDPIATNVVSNVIGEASDLVINPISTTPITAGVAADVTFVIINDGPNTAHQVTFSLPDVQGATWYTPTMSDGECLATQCSLGELEHGSWREINVHFLPSVAPTLTMTASVMGDGLEVNPIDNQATFQTTIADAPVADLEMSRYASVEVGATTIFTATALQGTNITYQWNFGDGVLATGSSTAHIYTTVGTYTVVVTATNTTNTIVATTTVRVLDVSITGLAANNSTPTQLGVGIAFTATIATGSNVNFSWDFGDGTLGAGVTSTHTYLNTGNYTVIVTATNSAGSVNSTLSVTIQDGSTPTPTPTPPPSTVIVNLPTAATSAPGGQVTLPVLLPNVVDGLNILGYTFRLTFDPAILTFINTDRVGTLSSGWQVVADANTPGAIQVTATHTTPATGSGPLLNLIFQVMGSANSATPLTWTSFTFNAGSPVAQLSNGHFTVQAWQLGGAVNYRTSSRPMSGVAINLTGATVDATTTDSNGIYSFTIQSTGAYTVTPGHNGGANGISAFDAAYIAQCVAGVRTMTDCPLLAADTSGNGNLSAFDAAQIAQYAAGLASPTSRVGQWAFAPNRRAYPTITGDLHAEHYGAYLIGEVSGNWQPPAAAVAEQDDSEPGNAPLSLTVSDGNELVVHHKGTVGDLVAYQITIHYDATAGRLIEAVPVANMRTDAGWEFVSNATTPGVVEIVGYGITPVNGAGELLTLRFQGPMGEAVMPAPTIVRARLNEEGVWSGVVAAPPTGQLYRQLLPIVVK